MERIGVALEEAVRIIEESICPVQNTEAAAVEAADGRILAEDVYASMDQPPFPRSPLDGFAFRSSDVEDACEAAPAVLRVNQIIYAGEWWKTSVGQMCIRDRSRAIITSSARAGEPPIPSCSDTAPRLIPLLAMNSGSSS